MLDLLTGRLMASCVLFVGTVALSACDQPEQAPSDSASASKVESGPPSPKISVRQVPVGQEALIQSCTNICAETFSLGCGTDTDCASACVKQYGLPVCETQLESARRCAESAKVSQYECGPSGAPRLKAGNCEPEKDAAVRCLRDSLAGQ